MPTPTNYWQDTRRLTAILVASWFAITFGTIFFARELSSLSFFGWPLSFYLLAQGVILIYAALIAFYAWRMERLDRKYREGSAHGQ
jgi:putative solute:sodium symporter small subunit